MKKLLLTYFALFSVNIAFAQDVHFGIKAGLNATNLRYEGRSESDYKLGVHAGGLAHIHVTRKFAIQPELLYSGMGGEQKGSDTKYNFNYLAIPVLGQYMFGDGFRVQAGPQVSFLLSAKREVDNNEVNIIDNYRTIDLSLPVGFSYVLPSGFGVDARWVFGLNNIVEASGGVGARNNGGQFGIFYLLQYGHAKH